MLPQSRDDLVSMSINEGGVVANVAAQGEAAASYDLNKLQMALKNLQKIKQSLKQRENLDKENKIEKLDELSAILSKRQEFAQKSKFKDLAELERNANMAGYSMGASGKADIYARAKAAFAYSRRREYLDAAITAAGRGDNFAKWVVRKSDTNSKLALQQNNLTAAKHNGFPNGDQPFNLLVKVPHTSVHKDWDDSQYILFNSSYSATKKYDRFWHGLGTVGLVLKIPVAVLYWDGLDKIQESHVGTVYPFKWDVKTEEKQEDLLRTPNMLGGRIELDDTDKIKYSEIKKKIEAENDFIKLTRETQSGALSRTLGEVKTEAGQFKGVVDKEIKQDFEALDEIYGEQSSKLKDKQKTLETRMSEIEKLMKAIQQQQNEDASSVSNASSQTN